MAKKNYRGNNTYLIEGNTGDNPKLMYNPQNEMIGFGKTKCCV